MGKLIPFPRHTGPGAKASESASAASLVETYSDNRELLPVELVLLVFSLARVAHALLRHERFGTEATVALFLVVVLPAVIASGCRKSL
jgi:hypothetical protein